MSQVLFFILGLIIGSLIAITIMCMLIISKDADQHIDIKKEEKSWKNEKEE